MMKERYPFWGKNIGINIPGSPYGKDFAANLHIVEYLWENPCISLVMKYTIEYHGSTHTF